MKSFSSVGVLLSLCIISFYAKAVNTYYVALNNLIIPSEIIERLSQYDVMLINDSANTDRGVSKKDLKKGKCIISTYEVRSEVSCKVRTTSCSGRRGEFVRNISRHYRYKFNNKLNKGGFQAKKRPVTYDIVKK